jgi:hypothetical protein
VKQALRRSLIGFGVVTVALTGLVGLMHTAVGRPWLQRVGGCPFGQESAAEVERLTNAAALRERGVLLAPARPCLGFVLEQSSPAEVRAWASKSGVHCAERLDGHLFLCRNVPAVALARTGASIEEVSLSFRVADLKLQSVAVLTRKTTLGDEISVLTSHLERVLGAPTSRLGEQVGAATFTQRYQFSDYLSELTATPIGTQIVVREQYTNLHSL